MLVFWFTTCVPVWRYSSKTFSEIGFWFEVETSSWTPEVPQQAHFKPTIKQFNIRKVWCYVYPETSLYFGSNCSVRRPQGTLEKCEFPVCICFRLNFPTCCVSSQDCRESPPPTDDLHDLTLIVCSRLKPFFSFHICT